MKNVKKTTAKTELKAAQLIDSLVEKDVEATLRVRSKLSAGPAVVKCCVGCTAPS
jgi:hypothetical protein